MFSKAVASFLLMGIASAQYNVFLYPEAGCGDDALVCGDIGAGVCCNGGGTLFVSTDAYDAANPTNVVVNAYSSRDTSYCAVSLGSSDGCFDTDLGFPVISGATAVDPYPARKRSVQRSLTPRQADSFSRSIDGVRYILKLNSPEYNTFKALPSDKQNAYIITHQVANMTTDF